MFSPYIFIIKVAHQDEYYGLYYGINKIRGKTLFEHHVDPYELDGTGILYKTDPAIRK